MRQVLSLVENFSHFTDPAGGVHRPFGASRLDALCSHARLPPAAAFRLPLEPHVNEATASQ